MPWINQYFKSTYSLNILVNFLILPILYGSQVTYSRSCSGFSSILVVFEYVGYIVDSKKRESSYLKNSYSLFSSLCCLWITFSIMALSSGVRCDKSGLLGPTWTPVVDPVELPGPKPELVEAANPESDMPPPELPILLPRALSVAARLLVGTIRRRNKKYYNACIGRQMSHCIRKVFLFSF